MAQNINIDELLKSIGTAISTLAKETFGGTIKKLAEENKAFLQEIKPNLVKYTTQLIAGDISELEFKDLIFGEKDLLEMRALTNAGVALIAIDQFKNGVIDIISKSLLGAIGL
ncbi:hypothetical protein ACJVDH_10075 [Pedobacter sp. AW1-32]|uniref:hypothetical protein n=1 Tax=Pedobacter sp. AW1-32 TaxID=3383026 RepID=UPI003FF12C51